MLSVGVVFVFLYCSLLDFVFVYFSYEINNESGELIRDVIYNSKEFDYWRPFINHIKHLFYYNYN